LSERGEVYSAFIEAELKAEDERRTSIDAKSIGIATSSSAFIALLIAVLTVVLGKEFTLPAAVVPLGLGGLGLYAIAALLGLLAGTGRKYQRVGVATLDLMVGQHWTDEEVDARNQVAYLRANTVKTLRVGNDSKSRILLYGIGMQLSASVVLILAFWQALQFRI